MQALLRQASPASKSCHYQARLSIFLLTWMGFVVTFIQRVDINLFMIQILNPTLLPWEDVCYEERRTVTISSGKPNPWTSMQMMYILSAFYWTYPFNQIAAVAFMNRFGIRITLGLCVLAASAMKLIFPFVTRLHISLAILSRAVEGLFSGCMWISVYAIVPHWIPFDERESFYVSSEAMVIGIAGTYLFYGIALNFCNWIYLCLVSGTLGFIWSICWFVFVYDTPHSHPWISATEQMYVEDHIASIDQRINMFNVPWTRVFQSKPLWAAGFCTAGRIIIHIMTVVYLPLYYTYVMGFSIKMTGIYCGTPYFFYYMAAKVFKIWSRKIVEKEKLSITNVRKLFAFIAQVIPGLVILVITFLDCYRILVVLCWSLATILCSATVAGTMSIPLDVCSNFSAAAMAFMQTIHMLGAMYIHFIIAHYTKNGMTMEAWNQVFYWIVSSAIILYLAFLFGGSAKEEPWNQFMLNLEHQAWRRKNVKTLEDIMTTFRDKNYLNTVLENKKVSMKRNSQPTTSKFEPTTSDEPIRIKSVLKRPIDSVEESAPSIIMPPIPKRKKKSKKTPKKVKKRPKKKKNTRK